MTYNIRGGLGIDGKRSVKRISEVILNSKADIVCLQEVHKYLFWSGLSNQSNLISQELKMFGCYSSSSRGLFGSMGNMILSKHPINDVQRFNLTSRSLNRCIISTLIEHDSHQFQVLCTHFGLSEAEREIQALEVAKLIAKDKPSILCGDFNAPNEENSINLLLNRSHLIDACDNILHTFPSYQPKVQIDAIFTSKHWRCVSCEAIKTLASDHLPLIKILEIQ